MCQNTWLRECIVLMFLSARWHLQWCSNDVSPASPASPDGPGCDVTMALYARRFPVHLVRRWVIINVQFVGGYITFCIRRGLWILNTECDGLPWFQASAAKWKRTSPFWDITQRVLVIPYRRFGTTYPSHLQGSRMKKKTVFHMSVRGVLRYGWRVGDVFESEYPTGPCGKLLQIPVLTQVIGRSNV